MLNNTNEVALEQSVKNAITGGYVDREIGQHDVLKNMKNFLDNIQFISF